MDVKTLIGRKVVQGGIRGNGEGVIVSVEGEYIIVDFGDACFSFAN